MRYVRMPIEVESPEEFGYSRIRNNLSESSISDRKLSDLGLTVPDLPLRAIGCAIAFVDGHWFELPDSCFRLGYGWPTRDELQAGLRGISRALRT